MKSMRIIVVIAAALLVGAILGHLIVRDIGYVLIEYGGYTYESSVWFFTCALFVILLIAYTIASILWHISHRSRSMAPGTSSAQSNEVSSKIIGALQENGLGNWSSASNMLNEAAVGSDAEPLLMLNAADAAQKAQEFETTNELLNRVAEKFPVLEWQSSLKRAEIELNNGDPEVAAALLRRLHNERPDSFRVLELLANCYSVLGDHNRFCEAMNQLRELDPNAAGRLEDTESSMWSTQIESIEQSEEVQSLWEELPPHLQRNERVVESVVKTLINLNNHEKAHSILISAIQENWNPRWVRLFGSLDANLLNQVIHAEKWLEEHPDDPSLAFALARMYRKLDRFDDAKEQLMAATFDRSLHWADLENVLLDLEHNNIERATELLNLVLSDPDSY